MQLHYCIATKREHLTRFFNAKPVYEYTSNYNATVDMFLPAILNSNTSEIVELKWHFPWSGHSFPMFSHFIPLDKIITHWKQPRNLRFVLLKAIRVNRCLVLANCFVVWHQNQPFCVYIQDQRMFAFGGIWNETSTHAGFALLTQPANELLLELGQQEMPFVLHERHARYWLNDKTSMSKISQLMKLIYPAFKMNAYPLGPLVNNPINNSPEIFKPAGERLNPDIDYGVKEKLVRQGWGRGKN
jgi:putative SOS response-associated peptidase YedK